MKYEKLYLKFLKYYACKKKLIVLYIIIVGFITLNAVISLIRPKLQAKIIDDLSKPVSISYTVFMTFLALFLGMLLISYIVSYLQRFMISIISEEIAADVRQNIHDKLGIVQVDFFSKVELSDILRKIDKDISAIKQCGITSIITLLSNIVILIVIPPYMLSIHKRIAVINIALLICVPFITRILRNIIQRISGQVLQGYSDITSVLTNTYNNWFVVRSFQCYQYIKDRYNCKNQKYKSAINKQNLLYIINTLSTLIIQFFGTVIIWVIGAKEVFNGNMTIGMIMALMNYQAIIMNPIIGIADFANEYHTAIVSLKDIDLLLSYPDTKINGQPVEYINEITLREVGFYYSNIENEIFKNINLTLKKGVLYAVHGKSGQGKSTLLKLIAGIYNPTKGNICINGIPTADYNLASYWSCIGYVMQRSDFFKDTIKTNMFYEENDAELDEIAKYIDIYEEIYALPQLWETEIKTDPYNFSEGQIRRMDIMRNILKNPEVLVFDEVTANIDKKRRRKFYDLLHTLSKDKIIIFSTHNFEELKEANEVIDISFIGE